jgi:hypothetical protein
MILWITTCPFQSKVIECTMNEQIGIHMKIGYETFFTIVGQYSHRIFNDDEPRLRS